MTAVHPKFAESRVKEPRVKRNNVLCSVGTEIEKLSLMHRATFGPFICCEARRQTDDVLGSYAVLSTYSRGHPTDSWSSNRPAQESSFISNGFDLQEEENNQVYQHLTAAHQSADKMKALIMKDY